MKIIINADDCGISSVVDAEIERCIIANKITSTTIMANMTDFEGAVSLYKKYHDIVSFGWHINLDEGEPITNSQVLLDSGFFIEKDGRVLLNGMKFRKSLLNNEMKKGIIAELKAQWGKLKDNGIEITHADSHHYMHTQPCMIQILPHLFKELNITCCRQVSNYGIGGISGVIRSIWSAYYKFQGLKMPQTFCSFADYYNNPNLKQGSLIELMVHPGHPKKEYAEEYEKMIQSDYNHLWPSAEIVTYKILR